MDAATGWPVSIQEHPNITTAAWAYAQGVAQQPMTGSAANQAKIAAYRRDLLPNCVNNAMVTGCTPGAYGPGSPTDRKSKRLHYSQDCATRMQCSAVDKKH